MIDTLANAILLLGRPLWVAAALAPLAIGLVRFARETIESRRPAAKIKLVVAGSLTRASGVRDAA